MNNHYIPRLLLRRFAENNKVNTYSFLSNEFAVKKIKNVFSENDLFDAELEAELAVKLEGPFGDLLNHRLLKGEQIRVNRRENLLIRKFFMILFLRAPIVKLSWEEMLKKTDMEDSWHAQIHNRMMYLPEYRQLFDEMWFSARAYTLNLRRALAFDYMEQLLDHRELCTGMLQFAAQRAMVTPHAVWDCADSGMEFIFPKLPAISLEDQQGILYKTQVLLDLWERKRAECAPAFVQAEIERLLWGNCVYNSNFTVLPISPTRAIVCFAPYFRAYFPMYDPDGKIQIYPPLLERAQFDKHFYEKMRMELFTPCISLWNRHYKYEVRHLTREETCQINGLFLNMETDEFVFHDYNRIRDTFWYYQDIMHFSHKKKHDFSHLI